MKTRGSIDDGDGFGLITQTNIIVLLEMLMWSLNRLYIAAW
jgi:hypothetical protein